MKFLVDAQLPRGLCTALQRRGHEADYVNDLIGAGAEDRDILALALRDDRIIISKDSDFVALHESKRVRFLWLRCGNMRNAEFIAWMEERWSGIEASLIVGGDLIEVA
ncbi:MAG: DUF5615 family PIN-like protein [Pseudomonadota bacterium]